MDSPRRAIFRKLREGLEEHASTKYTKKTDIADHTNNEIVYRE